jgi:hypothetical protein
LIYNGPAGVTVKAYAKSGHNSLLHTFSNVQPGDSLEIRSDVLNLTKLYSNTYFEVVGYIPDIVIPTACSKYIKDIQFGNVLTVYGYIDKEGQLCNMPEPPACPCDDGISQITVSYELFDSLTPVNATVIFYADATHNDTIAVFNNVDANDVLTVTPDSLPGGVFSAITFVEIVGSGRADVKLPTSCDAVEDDQLLGSTYRELFVENYRDGQGHGCDNECGVGKTLMCHHPTASSPSSHHWHSSSHWWGHGSHSQNAQPREYCVKNKDVNKKLQTGDWSLGPCSAWKLAQQQLISSQGFELTAQPNPFSESTTISFRMTAAERVSLVVYNVAGEEVAKLFEGVAEKDQLYQIEFKSEMNPDGMYFYRLVTEAGDVYIRKLVQSKQ